MQSSISERNKNNFFINSTIQIYIQNIYGKPLLEYILQKTLQKAITFDKATKYKGKNMHEENKY